MSASDGVVKYSNAVQSGPVDFSKPIEVQNLKGKTVVVTGGASGLGAAFCKAWAQHGAHIIVGDRNKEAGERLIADLRGSTKTAHHHFIHLDVLDWQSQASFFKDASKLSPHGGIDCVVANAGIADAAENDFFENPPDYQNLEHPKPPGIKTLEVNLSGVVYTTHLAMSYLARNPGSQRCSMENPNTTRDRHLILVSSIAGCSALPSQPLYCASKHGVVGLFRALRVTAPIVHGIRINMINPYFVDTPILGPGGALVLAGGGMSKIEDVVAAATRLAADHTIIGRGLMIGARATDEQLRAAGLDPGQRTEQGAAVWDVHAHDFEQTDLFTRRVIAVTNIVTTLRGWAGLFSDVAVKITAPLSTFWSPRAG